MKTLRNVSKFEVSEESVLELDDVLEVELVAVEVAEVTAVVMMRHPFSHQTLISSRTVPNP
jgi:hypothetical protein